MIQDPSRDLSLAPPVAGSTAPDATLATLADAGPSVPGPSPQVPGYAILGELGRGAMGVVYQARHLQLDRVVALKMILAGAHASPDDLVRFRREAEAVARLQHPGIVQIYEIGEHQGLPFFSLEYCVGGSLHRKLDGKPLTPREAARLVEALAGALAAAHAQKLIHRDLKPHNVLLGADGTPKIADFGLARRLDATGQTQSGAVVGTASYMPPEQARGERVGLAADVYALGAVLYELLTGRPPFLADNTLAILGQVLYAEPVPPRRLQPGVPRDLETICLCCLHKEPHRRYASALALADDLRRFQAGEPIVARPVSRVERAWKWAKRRPAVALLTAALVLAVAVGFGLVTWKWQDESAARAEAESNGQRAIKERDAAKKAQEEEARARAKEEAAKHLAEERRKEALTQAAISREYTRKALDAVKKVMVVTSQDILRDQPGAEAIRREIMENALQFQLGFLRDQRDDPVVREAVGYSYFVVAELQTEQEQFDKAEQAYRDGLAVFQRLARDFPEDPEYRFVLCGSHYAFGNYLRQRERYTEAVEEMGRAVALARALLAASPGRPSYQFGLANAQDGLGMVLTESGAADRAEPPLLAAAELYAALVLRRRAETLHLFGAALNQANLVVLYSASRPAQAVNHARLALELRLRLLAEAPDDIDFRKGVAQSHIALATALGLVGRKADAEAEYRLAIADLKRLHDEFSTVGYFQLNLAQSHSTLGILFLNEDRLAEAEEHLRLALPLQEKLVAQQPGHFFRRSNLAQTCRHLGIVLQRLGRPPEAEKYLRAALDHFRKLVPAPAGAEDLRQDLAETAVNLGALLVERGRPGEAEAVLREALELQQQRLDAAADAKGRLVLTSITNNLANAVGEQGRLDEAQKWFEKTVALREQLLAESLADAKVQMALAQAYINLGTLQLKRQQFKTAEKPLRAAQTLLEKMPAELIATADYEANTHKVYANLTQVLYAAGDPATLEYARKAVEWGQKVLASVPGSPTVRNDVAASHLNLGIVLRNSGKFAEAEKHFAAGRDLLEKLVEERPGSAELRFNLAKVHFNLGAQQVLREEWGKAETELRQGRGMFRKLAAEHPGVPAFAEMLKASEEALSWLRLRMVETALERQQRQAWKEVRQVMEALLEFDRHALEDEPGNVQARKDLILTCACLIDTYTHLKEHAAAAKLAVEFPRYKDDSAKIWLASAAYVGDCMALARTDAGLAKDERDRVSKGYGDKAMTALRQAVKLGFRDARLLREEASFAPLRERDDFQALIRQLEKE
jgi:tetratricopeptide (TPR) repeat protein